MDANFLLQTTTDGVAVTDSDGLFVYFNKAHRELFGYADNHEMIGMSWRTLYPDDEVRRIETIAFPALANRGHWQGILQARRADGSLFNERLSLSMLADGGILCICGEFTDEQLLQSKVGRMWQDQSLEMERRSRLFSIANHEIRSPLASILLASEMLKLQSGDSKAAKFAKWVDEIRNQAVRVGEMMDKFFFLGRQLSGALPFEPLETDLAELFDSLAAKDWNQHEPMRDVVKCRMKGKFTIRNVDSVLLHHAMGNLVSNALKYRNQDTLVKVLVDATHPDRLELGVENAGPKPDSDSMNNLFEPFHRHAYPTHAEAKGSGLGLYIVKECARAHGGDAWMNHTPDGVCVRMCLPAAVSHVPLNKQPNQTVKTSTP